MKALLRSRCWLLAGVALLVALQSSADDKPKAKSKELHVLFLGNSQIYYNELPRIVEALADSAPKQQPRIKASQYTPGGASLESLWNQGEDKGARGKIASEKWDYVILQERFDSKLDNFNKYAPLFHEVIEKNGSKMILFCTASISTLYPKGFDELLDMQLAMGKKLNVPVAAAGKAWLVYWGAESTPEQRLALYDPDKAHPGKKGSYIYACSLYAALTGQTPIGLTRRLPKQPEDLISAEEAKKYQEAAWKVQQEVNGKEKATKP
jgi:hypothetical protein